MAKEIGLDRNRKQQEKFKDEAKAELQTKERYPTRNCHGLLKCTSESCISRIKDKLTANNRETSNLSGFYMNRDTAAALNFQTIFDSYLEHGERPWRFDRRNVSGNDPKPTNKETSGASTSNVKKAAAPKKPPAKHQKISGASASKAKNTVAKLSEKARGKQPAPI
ncbi:hypothetical protein EV178_003556 [Coemansia sp. RSA 1646]|nr:hypothetical protein EV178_003556 [Coemansia sp. RSA 1646]